MFVLRAWIRNNAPVFYDCCYSISFWKNFESYYLSLTKQQTHLNLKDRLIGLLTPELPLHNYLLLIGKFITHSGFPKETFELKFRLCFQFSFSRSLVQQMAVKSSTRRMHEVQCPSVQLHIRHMAFQFVMSAEEAKFLRLWVRTKTVSITRSNHTWQKMHTLSAVDLHEKAPSAFGRIGPQTLWDKWW